MPIKDPTKQYQRDSARFEWKAKFSIITTENAKELKEMLYLFVMLSRHGTAGGMLLGVKGRAWVSRKINFIFLFLSVLQLLFRQTGKFNTK